MCTISNIIVHYVTLSPTGWKTYYEETIKMSLRLICPHSYEFFFPFFLSRKSRVQLPASIVIFIKRHKFFKYKCIALHIFRYVGKFQPRRPKSDTKHSDVNTLVLMTKYFSVFYTHFALYLCIALVHVKIMERQDRLSCI